MTAAGRHAVPVLAGILTAAAAAVLAAHHAAPRPADPPAVVRVDGRLWPCPEPVTVITPGAATLPPDPPAITGLCIEKGLTP